MGSVSEKEVQSVIRDVDVLKNHMERVSFTNVCMFVTTHPLSVVVTEYSRYNE